MVINLYDYVMVDLALGETHVSHSVTSQEIDYTKEATNAEKFAYNFREMPYIKVPTIIREFSTAQVCILSYI